MSTIATSGPIPFGLLKTVMAADEVIHLRLGSSTHKPALDLVCRLVRYITDPGQIREIVAACLPENYTGDTLREVPDMVAWALEHGLASELGGSYTPGAHGPVPLGYSGSELIFRHQQTKEIVRRTPHQLASIPGLLEMATKDFWESQFPRLNMKGAITGIDVISATDALIQKCRGLGHMELTRIRGAGIWVENSEVIVNLGEKEIESSEFIYSAPPRRIPIDEGDVSIEKILTLFSIPNWATPSAPELLLGGCAAAVICGALDWRPHIGITGPAQSGKSTVMTAIAQILRPLAVVVEGISTEAGIRQMLGHDARPVVMDEFELEGGSDQNRVARLAKLLRSSSSATGDVARGTQDGRGYVYVVRAMFIVAAINLYKPNAADATRVVRLEMRSPESPRETGERIRALRDELKGIGSQFCGRVIRLAPAILASIPKVHRHLPVAQERQADNLATLLAACEVMVHGRELSDEDALALALRHIPAVEAQREAADVDDPTEALNTLLGRTVSLDLGNQAERVSVGTVLAKLLAGRELKHLRDTYMAALHPLGLRVEQKGFLVANSHPGLSQVFDGTRWQGGMWGSALARLPGAEQTKLRRFADGVRSRAVFLPAEHLLPPDDEATSSPNLSGAGDPPVNF